MQKPAPCQEDTQAALRQGPYGKELICQAGDQATWKIDLLILINLLRLPTETLVITEKRKAIIIGPCLNS